jgi:hypothetical protein
VELTVLAGETEVLGGNLPRRHFVHHKFHLPNPGRRGGKAATNRFSYGAASLRTYVSYKQTCPFFSQNVVTSLVNTVIRKAIAKQRLAKQA